MDNAALMAGYDSGVVSAIANPGGTMFAPVAVKESQSAWAQAFLRGETPFADAPLGGPADAFRQALWVYRSVSVIAGNAARVPLRLSRGEARGTRALWGLKGTRTGRPAARLIRREKDAHLKAVLGEIVEAGPLYDLLQQPNPEQTWDAFCEQLVGLLYVCGRVHVLFDEMTGRRPLSMYPFPGTIFEALVPKAQFPRLAGWMMSAADGQRYPIALDECVTFQLLNPSEPYGGMAPRLPAHLAIVSDYNASLFNASMFGNCAEPGGVLKTDAPFSAEANEQLRTAWNQRHRGPGRAKSIAVLWGGTEWQSVASTMADMQFDAGKRLTRTEICAAFGVPEVVAGFYTDSNYQFAETGQQQFWWQTEMPLLHKIATGLQVHLASRFEGSLECWFDVEEVPIVQRMRNANLDPMDRLWAKGVPFAHLNELYDFGLPDEPHYHVGMLGAGLMPAADVATGNVFPTINEGPSRPGVSDELDQVDGGAGLRPAHVTRTAGGPLTPCVKGGTPATPFGPMLKSAMDRLWAAWAQSWSALAKAMRTMLRAHFLAQERRLLAALRTAGETPAPPAKQIDRSIVARLLLEIGPQSPDSKRLAARVRTFVADANSLGLRQALVEAGLEGAKLEEALLSLMKNPAIGRAIARGAIVISDRIQSRTRELLRHSLAEGIDAGEDVRKLADRVQDCLGNRRADAIRLARNSVAGVLSQARQEGQVAAGMTHKLWIYSRGPGERRPAHVAAEAEYAANPCPIDQPFVVNGVPLMYPRDWSAGRPDETVNCQCLSIARRFGPQERPTAAAMVAGPEAGGTAVPAVHLMRIAGETPATPEENSDAP